jgi:NADPH:quinone reductase-like Zn-dependent oxidoreductase
MEATTAMPAPAGLDDAEAAPFYVTYQTGWFGLHRRARLAAGETLLVHAAAGGVGSGAVQLGKAAGARVIGVVGGRQKAAVARELGAAVESVDYRGLDDPGERVRKLLLTGAALENGMVLVGSSMGGHVSATAAGRLKPRGLFLLAPAFYMAGYEQYTPQDVDCPTAIVHGWHDDIVPVENSIRWAREHRSALHILNSDHRLEDQIEAICLLLREFLAALG